MRRRDAEWPIVHPKGDAPDVIYLFVLNPPYSGSTALAKLLNSATNSMMLHPRGEGQWLIPGMCGKGKWDPKTRFDWGAVRSVWNERVRSVGELVGGIEVVIEKSPPNIVRADDLEREFPGARFLGFVRNPYANCSSIYHRQFSSLNLDRAGRERKFEQLGHQWIFWAESMRRWIEGMSIEWCSYESLCRSPAEEMEKIRLVVPELTGIDAKATIKVKDYPEQSLQDQNPRQVGQLRESEKIAISRGLSANGDVVRFFGYDPDYRVPIAQGGAS